MFQKIETALIELLQSHLETVPKKNIGVKPVSSKDLPALSLTNVDFEVKEVGLGRSIGEGGETLQDTFSGDDQTTQFSLKVKPLRPVRVVECPPGNRVKTDDYHVDYRSGLLIFKKPPMQANNNIVVRYVKPAESKTLQLHLRYHVNVWAATETQRDAIAIEVIESLLREEAALSRKEIFIKPIGGFNLEHTADVPDGIYGKTIEYSVESRLLVTIPAPRIETIELRKV